MMMSTTNVGVGGLDGNWELFEDLLGLDGLHHSDLDDVPLNADSLRVMGWSGMDDDDTASVSSNTSCGCLPGNAGLETYSEMYSDLCKVEGTELTRSGLLPEELIADIESCMQDDLSGSLDQLDYEINCLINAESQPVSSETAELLSDDNIVHCELVTLESTGSIDCKREVGDVCGVSVDDSEGSADPHSPDSAVTSSLECEELYEESVEDFTSTISFDTLHDWVTSSYNPSTSVGLKSEGARLCGIFHRSPPAEVNTTRRLRKKAQNKSAASRYRLKKRSEQGLVLSEYVTLERRNIELRTRLDAMSKEVAYLKSLIAELCP